MLLKNLLYNISYGLTDSQFLCQTTGSARSLEYRLLEVPDHWNTDYWKCQIIGIWTTEVSLYFILFYCSIQKAVIYL